MKAKEELQAVKGKLADIEQAQREIMREPCSGDERHCTCVPLLKMEVQRLRALCKEAADTARRWHAPIPPPGHCSLCGVIKRLRKEGKGK